MRDIFNRILFYVMSQGDAHDWVLIFPISTTNVPKDLNWDSDNLQGSWEITRKYGSPYFSNFVNSDMKTEDAHSMCCRLYIANRQLETSGSGRSRANPLAKEPFLRDQQF
jgi:ribonucleoside-triphosphate reductase